MTSVIARPLPKHNSREMPKRLPIEYYWESLPTGIEIGLLATTLSSADVGRNVFTESLDNLNLSQRRSSSFTSFFRV
jgi:hypothetical protein